MRRRTVPNTISKRFRRKLRRSETPYLLWLRCKRPHVWVRLTRLWSYRLLERITSIPPSETPFVSFAGRLNLEDWRLDEPETYARN